MKKELTRFIGDKPVKKEEFEKAKKNAVLELAGNWETNEAVLNDLQLIKPIIYYIYFYVKKNI